MKHFTHFYGRTIHVEGRGVETCAIVYGALQSVYASEACNYSYREFWF